MPARENLSKEIWKGDSFALPLRFQIESGIHDISGKTLTFMIKKNRKSKDEDAIFSKAEVLAGGDALVGEHTIVLLPSETSGLPKGNYEYQVQLTTPDTPEDIVVTYIHGKVCIQGN